VRKLRTEPIRELKRPTHGYIGLQTHDPGDVVWFKEVSVRCLVGAAKQENVPSVPGLKAPV
jgi:hypothetical protein